MSQDVSLQPGEYVFSCVGACPDPYPTYLALVSGTDTIAKFNLSATEWTRFSYQFNLTEAKNAKVVLLMNHTNTTAQHRLFIDNIVLSDDAKELYKEQLSTLTQTLANFTSSIDGSYPLGYKTKLEEMSTNAEELLSSSTVTLEELKALYESMDAVYKECLTSGTVYTELSNLDNDAYVEWHETGTYATGVPALKIAEEAANAVLTGDNSLKSDFEQAITDLTAAIRAYKLSEVSFATKTAPIDLTWLIDTPTFTKEGGDVATAADRVQGAWVNGNNVTSNSGLDVRLNTVTGYNCWNSWANAWQGTMDLYQNLANLPVGLYTVSAKHVSNGNASTTTHVYATTVAGTKSSPICNNIYEGTGTFATDAQWIDYQTDTILVASDGALRIGITSTGEGTKAGWFCVTDFKLNYYGATDILDEYKKSLAAKIEGAKTLATKEMLVSETAAINSAITAAETADASTVAAIEATLATLNVAIAEADTAALAMSTFKAGSYATLVAQSTDAGGSTGLAGFVNGQIEAVDAALVATDATSEVYTSLGKKLAIAVSYGKAQIAASAAAQLHDDIASLLLDVQDY
ncbi:MAG: hypothetical protein KBH23_07005, partial [Bacteroidaceae bacterium]|nr:hypothetical protein [Bacteroidaceae bacterium]